MSQFFSLRRFLAILFLPFIFQFATPYQAMSSNEKEEPKTLESINLSGNISTTDISCFGGNDGTASAEVTGGEEPYFYNWSTGSMDMTITGLSAGSYFVTVSDNLGDSIVLETTLFHPDQIVISFFASDPSCSGFCDGEILLNIIGGNPPYQYQWDGPTSGGNPMDLCAGNYNVTVTDASNCSSSNSITLTDPEPISLSLTVTDESNDGNDGMITAAPSGGANPYTYQWDDPFLQTTPTAINLAPGTYCVTVTDENDCTMSGCETVEAFSCNMSLEVSSPNVSCFNVCDAEIDITVLNGTEPYTYAWNNISIGNVEDPQDLCPGGYSVTVFDDNGCTASISTFVSGNSEINADITYFVQSCPPTCKDSIEAIITGGTLPYTFEWNNGDTTANPGSLCQGNYQLTLTDAVGCQEVFVPIEIIAAPPIEGDVTTTEVSCNNACDGSISISAIGGIPPFDYDWENDDYDGESLVTGLCAGSYTVVVTDSGGCASVVVAEINQPMNLGVFTATTNACFGECNGTVVISVTGGTQPYTYVWSNGPDMLCPGDYTVTVTDATGCTGIDDFTVFENTEITYEVNNITHETDGQANGAIDISVDGGTPPYIYNWLLNSVSVSDLEDPTDLAGGMYTCVVSDAFGCTITTEEIVVDNLVNTIDKVQGSPIRIYPNPVSDHLFIQYDFKDHSNVVLEIFDIRGLRVLYQEMNTINAENKQLNTSQLSGGVYTLKVSATSPSQSEKETYIFKFIKQ